MDKLIEAKARLYLFLLRKPNEKMTNGEINICYELSFDDDIRAIFTEALEKERTVAKLKMGDKT